MGPVEERTRQRCRFRRARKDCVRGGRPESGLIPVKPAGPASYEGMEMKEVLPVWEEVFTKALMASPASICIATLRDPRYVEVNETFERIWGYGRGEVIGRSVADVGIWPRMDQWEYVVRMLKVHGKLGELEVHQRTRTAEERIMLSWAELIDLSGEPCILFVATDITARTKAEETLRQASAYNRSLIEASLDPLIMIGPDLTIRDANSAMEMITGSPRDALIGTDFPRHFTEPEKAEGACRQAFRTGLVRDCPLDIRHHDGRFVSVLYNASICWDEDGAVIGVVGAARDITERKQAEARLLESEARYRTAIEHSNDGVAIVAGGRHAYVNKQFLSMFGYDGPEDIIGDTSHKEAHPDDREMVIANEMKRQRGEPAPSRYEYRGIKKDGAVIFVEASVAATVYQGEPASLSYLRDVTERKQMEEKLRTMSLVDELTGLYNRRGFLTLAQQQVKLAQRTKEEFELFFIDLDGMKHINDELGHHAGDEALIETADLLRRTFRESDIVGRMGGDEFAVLAINAPDECRKSLIKRLNDNLDRRNGTEERKYRLSLSVGAAAYNPQRPSSLDDLIATADALMYEEKRRKKHEPNQRIN